jgi:hypothetical protein
MGTNLKMYKNNHRKDDNQRQYQRVETYAQNMNITKADDLMTAFRVLKQKNEERDKLLNVKLQALAVAAENETALDKEKRKRDFELILEEQKTRYQFSNYSLSLGFDILREYNNDFSPEASLGVQLKLRAAPIEEADLLVRCLNYTSKMISREKSVYDNKLIQESDQIAVEGDKRIAFYKQADLLVRGLKNISKVISGRESDYDNKLMQEGEEIAIEVQKHIALYKQNDKRRLLWTSLLGALVPVALAATLVTACVLFPPAGGVMGLGAILTLVGGSVFTTGFFGAAVTLSVAGISPARPCYEHFLTFQSKAKKEYETTAKIDINEARSKPLLYLG